MRYDLYTGFEPSQLSCLGSLVGNSAAWRADGRGFESHPRQPILSLKNDCFGRVVLCLSVVLLLLPCLSPASLGVIVHVLSILDR